MKPAILIVFIAIMPYFVGVYQYHNACMVIANITEQTDSDIEDVLSVFNFDIDALTTPTPIDYYKSGVKSIKELLN